MGGKVGKSGGISVREKKCDVFEQLDRNVRSVR